MGLGGTLDYFVDGVFNYPTLAECYKVERSTASNKLAGTGIGGRCPSGSTIGAKRDQTRHRVGATGLGEPSEASSRIVMAVRPAQVRECVSSSAATPRLTHYRHPSA